MEQLMAGTVVRARFLTLLFGLFAALALTLSALGIYAVISYRVALEARDIGIRMALGATRSQVLARTLAEGGRLALTGVLLGVAGALGLTRLLASQLYEITTTDPTTFAMMAAGLMLVALFACWLPARRAAGIDPTEALREE
jgi:ABC-type antimicrobial peptide transport system permease subunit